MERQISIRLPAGLLARIDREARRSRRRRSDVIRGRLAEAFGNGNGARGLWLDRVRGLIGSVSGAPADLSTSGIHMKDFGRGRRG